jgi:hypothetical protein
MFIKNTLDWNLIPYESFQGFKYFKYGSATLTGFIFKISGLILFNLELYILSFFIASYKYFEFIFYANSR